MFHVVLNEELLPQPYPTREAANKAGKALAKAFEAAHGAPASWFVAKIPALN